MNCSFKRSNKACGDIKRMRAAISSITNGKPSKRAQMAETVLTFSALSTKSGRTARARSANKVNAGKFEAVSRSMDEVSLGTSNAGTGYSHSPETRKDSRLVAKIFRQEQAERREEASEATSSMRCS